MRVPKPLCVLALLAAGCGGDYYLTAGDQLAPAGAEGPIVVRLQRSEIWRVPMPIKKGLIRFDVPQVGDRGAYTDDLGYAGTTLKAPAEPGVYPVGLSHKDRDGDIVEGELQLYVWDADRPVVAVDYDSLPERDSPGADAAWAALRQLSAGANLLYVTRRETDEHEKVHAELRALTYPDGPVLLWQRERWHIVREGRFRIPRVVVESRLVSQLAELRAIFPGLDTGVSGTQLGAKAFLDAGLTCAVVGPVETDLPGLVRYATWADFAAERP